MINRDEVLSYGLSFEDSYLDMPFHDENWQLVRVKSNKKAFLWTFERNGYININVKVNAKWRDIWRMQYEAVMPAYHQNKEHWNTVVLNGTVPDEEIKEMIKLSYDIITYNSTKLIYEAVKRIPSGKVATYKQIAKMAGNERMSRAVGNALHKNPDPINIPCFRVVNSLGKLSDCFVFGGKDEQVRRLQNDGVEVVNYAVDLEKYGIKI